jgi:uncharacterized membrane protein YgdD (TMEM256/DUF423 family)
MNRCYVSWINNSRKIIFIYFACAIIYKLIIVQKGFLIASSLAGLTAIIFGAFGAHGLKPLIRPEDLSMWDKGVQYQIYHALAMFVCYLFLRKEPSTYIRNAGICFLLGIICFSGSLYLLATRDLTNIPTFIIGPITPIGGFFFIAGWSFVFIQAVKTE